MSYVALVVSGPLTAKRRYYTLATVPKLSRPRFYETSHGAAYLGDSVELMRELPDHSVDVICTSPPFALLRQKKYGNVSANDYVEWFLPFATQFKRILAKGGSLVIDLGGTWLKGIPYRSLYHYEFLLQLCKPEEEDGLGFFLAQELYWYNPAKLPTPAEWVTIRRIRVKDAVNTVWWLRPSAVIDHKDGKVSNRRVLKPYSDAQKHLMRNGYKPKMRPSEHDISSKFGKDNKGAIPPNILPDSGMAAEIGKSVAVEVGATEQVPVNVIAASNTSSNDRYQRRCREENVKPHPARFPAAFPRFIIGLCSEEGDLVLDPFAGSNTTGFVAQGMNRNWLAFERTADYLRGSVYRFPEIDIRHEAIEAAPMATDTMEKKNTDVATALRRCSDLLATPDSDLARAFQGLSVWGQQLVAASKALNDALQPANKSMQLLSAEIARTMGPYKEAFTALSAWSARLNARMSALQVQWTIPDLHSVSVIGFARMVQLSYAVHGPDPYSESVSNLVADELGSGYEADPDCGPIQRDEAATRAGLRPELIAFQPETYTEVMIAGWIPVSPYSYISSACGIHG